MTAQAAPPPRQGPSEARQADPTAAVIETWLVGQIAELLAVDPQEIDVRQPFASYGLGSAEGVILAGDLEVWLGCSLPATIAWDYPTIESLAHYLAGEPGATEPGSATTLDQQTRDGEIDRLLTAVEQLSEDEVRSLLEAESARQQKG
ncbi:MAG TPA: acyl carrier protein [Candidatus Binatia bacterium]|nr:acyl carrier protein [Candidatus Binatia bacterium]